MECLRTQERFNSTAAGGAALGPYRLALQGDAPKRRINCILINVGRDSDDSDLAVKAQYGSSSSGPWTDVDAGSKTVKLRCQEVYNFHIEGGATHWRLHSTGKGVGILQVFDSDEFANVMSVGD